MIPQELEDAAFVIVQLEPAEHADIKVLRDSLRNFAVFDESAAPQVRALAQQAATKLNLILLGGAPSDDALLLEAGQAIEQAIREADRLTMGHGSDEDLAPIVRDAGDVTGLDAAMSGNTPPAAVEAATTKPAAKRGAAKGTGSKVAIAPAPDEAVVVAPAIAPSVATPPMQTPVAIAAAHAPTSSHAPSAPGASVEVPHYNDGGAIPADADLALLKDFIAESRDGLTGAEAALLALESNPADIEAINTVFRAFHTVKGTAAFMGLDRLADFAHHAESLLSRVRDRELPYTQAVASLSLRSSDLLGEFLNAVERSLQTHDVIALPSTFTAVMSDLLNVDAFLLRAPVAARADAPSAVVAMASDAAAPAAKAKSDADLSVRVRTDRLDRLIDMVGELVIAQSMIAADPAVNTGGRHELVKKVTHSGKIVRELQDLSMSMRMVPLKGTFQKLTRLVRDVALKAGKIVELTTEGDDTELDRNMVDVLGDPLVHMVRNAIDHGVEGPDDREKAGKSRAGKVRLAAFTQGASVIVELRDDGRGLNRDRILSKAIEKGLVSSSASMTDSEINALIFAPGFSTAEQITDISGRGVGMDVVRRNIESIRGRIDIHSVLGQGTTFQIRLPLTLAVTDGMLVRVGEERYIVPLTSIALSFRPEAGMLSTIPASGEVVMLRGEVLPVLRLHEVFGIPGAVTTPSDAILMIVGDGEHRMALLVDQLLGQQQVVAKTLGERVGEIPGISGGAILNDGRVGLIIDIASVMTLARAKGKQAKSVAHAA
jgi:two-component system, chemotaxis family, sensor kinase CheA